MAGNLQVSPVNLDLPARHAATILTLRNNDDIPMNVQVRVFRWTQTGGEDRLTPTDEVVASPPIAPLEPHSERLVRVVRIARAVDAEQSYRLIVDELPPPPDTGDHRVRLLMRHSIPLFFGAEAHGAAKISWATTSSDAGITLTAKNDGDRHIRISNLKLLDSAGGVLATRAGLLGYVLAGSQAAWVLPSDSQASRRVARLSAEGDAGTVDVAFLSAP